MIRDYFDLSDGEQDAADEDARAARARRRADAAYIEFRATGMWPDNEDVNDDE